MFLCYQIKFFTGVQNDNCELQNQGLSTARNPKPYPNLFEEKVAETVQDRADDEYKDADDDF